MRYDDYVVTARRAIAGERDALDRVWRQHRGWLAAVVMARMPVEAELDDVMQEVAIAVIRSIHTLEDPQALQPWLRRVALNTVRTAGRRAASVRARTQPGLADTSPDAEARRDNQRQVQAAMRLIHTLPEHYREPLLLRAARGLTQRQIAKVLELPERTVETRLRRARRLLAEQCENTFEAEFDPRAAASRGDSRAQDSGNEVIDER